VAAELFVGILTWYGAAGLLFAVAFLAFGLARVDPQAKGAGFGFRLMILPGAAALWPVLLSRWMRGRS
jgi:hypothetical protein